MRAFAENAIKKTRSGCRGFGYAAVFANASRADRWPCGGPDLPAIPANSPPAGKKSNPGRASISPVARSGKKRRLDQMLTHSFELFPAVPSRENLIPANRLAGKWQGKVWGTAAPPLFKGRRPRLLIPPARFAIP